MRSNFGKTKRRNINRRISHLPQGVTYYYIYYSILKIKNRRNLQKILKPAASLIYYRRGLDLSILSNFPSPFKTIIFFSRKNNSHFYSFPLTWPVCTSFSRKLRFDYLAFLCYAGNSWWYQGRGNRPVAAGQGWVTLRIHLPPK